ncbi:MAG: glycosyltransferase family 2 protein [Candidatus Ancaeobacter aquaticus]|nr:glycosyltransferase family 2 protein [Candidatus Ancaeobacter aquaticus]
MKAKIFSIIILNWNGKKWLRKCIDSVLQQSFKKYEIIFVDNNSSDDSVKFVEENYPFIKVINNDQNFGYAKGNNIGADIASGDFIFFLNSDAYIEKDCLEHIDRAICSSQNKVNIFALKMFSYDKAKNLYPNNSWMIVDVFGYPHLGVEPFYSDGAALVISRNLFDKLKGFDEYHFMYAEDIDLCWRAKLIGCNVVGLQAAIVYHSVSGSSFAADKDSNMHITSVNKRYLVERNTIRNLLKNYSTITLLWIVPLLLLMYFIECFLCIFLRRSEMIYHVYIKALQYNFAMLKNTIEERNIIQKKRVVSDIGIFKYMTFRLSKVNLVKKVGISNVCVKNEK